MILLHENLNREADNISKIIENTLDIPVKIVKKDLSGLFNPIPKFDGYDASANNVFGMVQDNHPKKAVMLLTDKDLYVGTNSKEDEWIFGYNIGKISVVSTARMKGRDNRPIRKVSIPFEEYLKRLSFIVVHEIGHDIVHSDKHLPAYWVNRKTGEKLSLGPHCINNHCVMYEVVDIKTPPKEEGYMLLGNRKRYDAGLDEHIARLKEGYFCKKCLDSIKITKQYK